MPWSFFLPDCFLGSPLSWTFYSGLSRCFGCSLFFHDRICFWSFLQHYSLSFEKTLISIYWVSSQWVTKESYFWQTIHVIILSSQPLLQSGFVALPFLAFSVKLCLSHFYYLHFFPWHRLRRFLLFGRTWYWITHCSQGRTKFLYLCRKCFSSCTLLI